MYVYRNVYIDIQISVSACPLMHRNIYIAIYTCACVYVCVRVDIYGEDAEERRKKHSADVAEARRRGVALYRVGGYKVLVHTRCLYICRHIATHCNTLQHTATYSSTQSCKYMYTREGGEEKIWGLSRIHV